MLWLLLAAAPATAAAQAAPDAPRGQFTVVVDGITDTGADELDVAVVGLLRSRRAAFLHWYELALARDASLAGRVTIAFTFTSEGATTDVRVVANTTGDDDLAARVTRIVGGLRLLPRPGLGGATYTVPLDFAPVE